MRNVFFSIVTLFFCGLFAVVQADEWALPSSDEGTTRKTAQEDTSIRDIQSQENTLKRLPPVLPGEVVGRGENKMKVWSSAGPVPVGRAPELPSVQYGDRTGTEEEGQDVLLPSDVGVIVDQRK